MSSAEHISDESMVRQERHDPAFLTYGFRPFFLGAGVLSALSVVVWLARVSGLVSFETHFPAASWHSHEMIFGFAAAVITGFLLTAVPNWTGCAPLRGAWLGGLFALWLAGRGLMWIPAGVPGVAVMAVDVIFLMVLIIWLARELWRARAGRNMIFIVLIAGLLTASVFDHAAVLGWAESGGRIARDLGLGTVALLIVIVGGRVIPAFTRNALAQQGLTVREHTKVDVLAMAVAALAVLSEIVLASHALSGFLSLAAAVCLAARMRGWQTYATRDNPLLWVLHLGYLWLVAGFALKGMAFFVEAIPRAAALHALTAGAIGTMTLAMMTRAALGHTGRPLKAPAAIVVAYVLVSLAAILRISSGFLTDDAYLIIVIISGCLWFLAFALFSLVYWPILTGPCA